MIDGVTAGLFQENDHPTRAIIATFITFMEIRDVHKLSIALMGSNVSIICTQIINGKYNGRLHLTGNERIIRTHTNHCWSSLTGVFTLHTDYSPPSLGSITGKLINIVIDD